MQTSASLPPLSSWVSLVELALAEDVGAGDVTTQLTIAAEAVGRAQIEAREELVVCGLDVAAEVFRQVDPGLAFEAVTRDGDRVRAGTPVLFLSGRVRGILVGERTALNFLSRLCGIATHALRFVEAVAGTRAAIVDTRKTLPGWRVLDKYAAVVGGALNHRVGLYDGILLKDNHIAAGGGVGAAVKAALANAPAGLRVQVEVQDESEVDEALAAGADFLLLDNLTPEITRRIVERCDARVLLESSGGIRLDNVRDYAKTGVHRISVGALTHSAPASDLALEMVRDAGSSAP